MTTPKPGQNHISNTQKENNPIMKTEKYTRKPFEVEAVQVTDENFEDVAAWCDGTIVTSRSPKSEDGLFESESERYIKVDVSRPLNERQTKAYVGDWLLSAVKGFKVYADGPFTRNFTKVPKNDIPQELIATDEVVE